MDARISPNGLNTTDRVFTEGNIPLNFERALLAVSAKMHDWQFRVEADGYILPSRLFFHRGPRGLISISRSGRPRFLKSRSNLLQRGSAW